MIHRSKAWAFLFALPWLALNLATAIPAQAAEDAPGLKDAKGLIEAEAAVIAKYAHRLGTFKGFTFETPERTKADGYRLVCKFEFKSVFDNAFVTTLAFTFDDAGRFKDPVSVVGTTNHNPLAKPFKGADRLGLGKKELTKALEAAGDSDLAKRAKKSDAQRRCELYLRMRSEDRLSLMRAAPPATVKSSPEPKAAPPATAKADPVPRPPPVKDEAAERTRRTQGRARALIENRDRAELILACSHPTAKYQEVKLLETRGVMNTRTREPLPEQFALLYQFRWLSSFDNSTNTTDLFFFFDGTGTLRGLQVSGSTGLVEPFTLAELALGIVKDALLSKLDEKGTEEDKRLARDLLEAADARGLLRLYLKTCQD